jgi:hypothetical protein
MLEVSGLARGGPHADTGARREASGIGRDAAILV